MTRSWRDVKAEKARRDKASGRDLAAARAQAHARTQAYVSANLVPVYRIFREYIP